MKNDIRSFLLLAILSLSSATGSVAYALSQESSSQVVGSRHLLYYGYYASAMTGVGTGNYMSHAELMSHTNL